MLVEIERKFLLRALPARTKLDAHGAEVLEIEQFYLRVRAGVEERIRSTSSAQGVECVHTFLTAHRPGVREISEQRITSAEYERLSLRADTARGPVVKSRWRLPFGGHLLELDDIHSPRSRACVLLEVQITDEQEEILLPSFLEIEREVTGERYYSNADIALG